MSKQFKSVLIIWVVAGLVVLGAVLYINHEVNAMIKSVGVVDNSPTELRVVDHTTSNVEPQLQADGGDTDIQPALGYKALTWHFTSATQQTLDVDKAIKSGGLVWVR